MQRFAIFGGSFDPIHQGHLLVAQAALEELSLDRVFFVPAAQSPFKPGVSMTDAATRLRMLRFSLAAHSAFSVDDQEMRRGGISYSIDTVRDFRQRWPRAVCHYLIGADHATTLPKWRDAAELASLAEFVVIPRPGQPPPELPAPFRGSTLRGFPLGLSSSQVRERVRRGLSIDLLVRPGVAEIIRNNRLYL